MALTISGGEVYLSAGGDSDPKHEAKDNTEKKGVKKIVESLWNRFRAGISKQDRKFERFFKTEVQSIIWKAASEGEERHPSKEKKRLAYLKDLAKFIGNFVGSSLWVLVKSLMKAFYSVAMGLYMVFKAWFWVWKHRDRIGYVQAITGESMFRTSHWVVQWLATLKSDDDENALKEKEWTKEQKDQFIEWVEENKINKVCLEVRIKTRSASAFISLDAKPDINGKIPVSAIKDTLHKMCKFDSSSMELYRVVTINDESVYMLDERTASGHISSKDTNKMYIFKDPSIDVSDETVKVKVKYLNNEMITLAVKPIGPGVVSYSDILWVLMGIFEYGVLHVKRRFLSNNGKATEFDWEDEVESSTLQKDNISLHLVNK